jgi:hypothetical protein
MELPKSREEAERMGLGSLYETPEHWPRHIQRIPIDLFDNFGRDPGTNEIYWDGKALVTEKRFTNFERTLGVLLLLVSSVGVAAAVVQAAAAVRALA